MKTVLRTKVVFDIAFDPADPTTLASAQARADNLVKLIAEGEGKKIVRTAKVASIRG